MTDEQLLDVVREALFRAKPKLAKKRNLKFGLDSRLDDFGLDSLATMNMAGYVEDALDIMFDERELAKQETVRQFIALIRVSPSATALET